MTNNSKVSIIIPTYNQENYISTTIGSALSQDYPNLEIIISDDNSTDNTQKIISELLKKDIRIKYFQNSNNLGRVGNYHKALYEYATGEYVLNLDGDDQLIDNTFISDAISLIKKNTEIKLLVACKQLKRKKSLTKLFHKIDKASCEIHGADFVYSLENKYRFSHLTTLYRRQDALKIDFYRKNIISTDKESLLRLALLGDVIVYNKIVGQWNDTGKNDSKNQSFHDATENLIWIKNIFKALKTKTDVLKAIFWKIRMKLLYAPFIIKAIKEQEYISISQIVLLFKNRVFIITIISSIKILLDKLFYIKKNEKGNLY